MAVGSLSDWAALQRSVRRRSWALLAGVGLGALVAPASALTLAIAAGPGFTPVQLAKVQGYFAAEGLTLDVIRCVNGRRCLQHLLEGEAELATVADAPIVLASFARSDFAIVAAVATSASENKVVARADRGIRTPADLKGKRIGVVKGTSGHYFTDSYLLYHGIEPSQVTLVPLDPANQVVLLARGEVDAVGSYEPMGYQARRRLGDQAVFLPTPKLFNIHFNLVAKKGAVSDADLKKLLRAMQRAARMMREEPARARALAADWLGTDTAMLDAIWVDYRFELTLDQSLLSALEAQARWARRQGLVDGARAPDYLDYVHPGPLRSLDPRAVTLVK
ncbi:ABC transporter substrate-binding protein [uncultured Methylibium sp.]|uniref:ABC transporter substrate-binding protein n=1 Tax=uncultured Methylibium sp. TaxID=381093 RepID=UPI0025CCE007|nr:ABC transporter substrate-binding protein [uncultured Methylibium sp.]